MQRLQGTVVLVGRIRVAESARQQQVGEPRDQILEIQVVELVAGEPGIPVLH